MIYNTSAHCWKPTACCHFHVLPPLPLMCFTGPVLPRPALLIYTRHDISTESSIPLAGSVWLSWLWPLPGSDFHQNEKRGF